MSDEAHAGRRASDPVLLEHIRLEEERNKTQDDRLKKIEDDITEIKASIKGLLDAWNAASTVGNFLKWLAAIAAAILLLGEAISRLFK